MIEANLASFVAGYLRARAQTEARVSVHDGALLVSYRQPFVRQRELFVWNVDSVRGFEVGREDWVTIFHRGPLTRPAWIPGSFAQTASEFFMSARLPLRVPPSAAAGAMRVSAEELAPLGPVDGPPPGEAACFMATSDGQPGASGRFGLGTDADIVVDRMVTLPAFRRRGLARSILAAMDVEARRLGRERMLLISSQEGRPLYESAGFELLAPVSVFAKGAP